MCIQYIYQRYLPLHYHLYHLDSSVKSAGDNEREEKRGMFSDSNDQSDHQDENEHYSQLPPQPPPLHLYLDVQMNSNLDLYTAHSILESFEKRLKNEIPEIKNVTTHIEIEASEDVSIIGTEKKASYSFIEKIRNTALSVDRVVDCKDISVVDVNGKRAYNSNNKDQITDRRTCHYVRGRTQNSHASSKSHYQADRS